MYRLNKEKSFLAVLESFEIFGDFLEIGKTILDSFVVVFRFFFLNLFLSLSKIYGLDLLVFGFLNDEIF